MNWTWRRYGELSLDELYDLLALRCRVFILEQGVYQDPDGVDRHAFHLLGRDDQGTLVAYLRAVDPGARFAEASIGRVLTAPECRGQGQGRALMLEGLARCSQVWPGQPIRISAQAHLQGFYGSLGFVTVGEVYDEDGIPHVQMLRTAP